MKGFWTKTQAGDTVHINGDPNMSEKTRLALCNMMDALTAQYKEEKINDPEWVIETARDNPASAWLYLTYARDKAHAELILSRPLHRGNRARNIKTGEIVTRD